MAERSLDAVVLVAPEHVQYFTGHRWDFRFAPAVAMLLTGETQLVCPDKPLELEQAAATEVRTYVAKRRSTLRTDQREASSAVLGDWLATRRRQARVGVEFSVCPPHVTRLLAGAEVLDVDLDLLALRRRKDPDELVLLRRAIAATGAMYEAARQRIRPGVSELEIFSALQAAAVETELEARRRAALGGRCTSSNRRQLFDRDAKKGRPGRNPRFVPGENGIFWE
jgi:Xaa-Pro aminopeptidase